MRGTETDNKDETEGEDGTEDDDSDMKFAREMVERDSAMATGLPWTVQYMDQMRNVLCQGLVHELTFMIPGGCSQILL